MISNNDYGTPGRGHAFKLLIILTFIMPIVSAFVSCSRSGTRNENIITSAEQLMSSDTDSALYLLEQIEPSELTDDSIRAKYHYIKAWGHMTGNYSMIGDSMISFAHDYYRGNDIVKDIRTGTALAWYKFWCGDTDGAMRMLDSISGLSEVPDSLMVQTLRFRVMLGVSEYQGRRLIAHAKRLVNLETDSIQIMLAKYALVNTYEYAALPDSALMLIEELIDYARANHMGNHHFHFEIERAQILTEMGLHEESDKVINSVFANSSPDNGAADYLHLQYAINALNSGNSARASRQLARADSFALKFRSDDDAYYRTYSNLMHAMIEFSNTGRLRLTHINGLNNRQSERFNRMKASQWESERGALQQHSRALALKAESEHKTVIILLTALVAVLILVAAIWIIRLRRHRERENEERIEALQKMVDEFNAAPAPTSTDIKNLPALRRAMLQQLGIIKMVAETPTEQNREMLRKISSIDGDTNGELVNWENVFEVIDSLYAGFYERLHSAYGDVLTNKEEQIIVLMTAGFSTKEISVITGQTTSTIYVRKSSIRKKLGAPEKEDIVAFLRDRLSR